MSFTIISCSKKSIKTEEVEPVATKIYSGGYYNYCGSGPFYFNIDSLLLNCPFPYSLDELLDSSTMGPTGLVLNKDKRHTNCEPKSIAVNESNWDFSITIGIQISMAIQNGYELEWQKTPLSQQPITVKTIHEGGKYPFPQFLNGYEIQISGKKTLTLLFFNIYIGGCVHDYMVWEYIEE